jgi:hypothetical protein
MNYPERKTALARAILAHPTNHPRGYAHDDLLADTGACTDSARLGGYRYIQKHTESRAPILLAQEAINGRHVALFEISE